MSIELYSTVGKGGCMGDDLAGGIAGHIKGHTRSLDYSPNDAYIGPRV